MKKSLSSFLEKTVLVLEKVFKPAQQGNLEKEVWDIEEKYIKLLEYEKNTREEYFAIKHKEPKDPDTKRLMDIYDGVMKHYHALIDAEEKILKRIGVFNKD